MKKIIVTGGAGFIGSHLCERLLSEGNEVICLDNFVTGNIQNIQQLLTHPYFKVVEKDVIEPFYYEADQIYNLACPASPVQYQVNPVQTLKTCFVGSLNALELAEKTGATILQASTSEVYGDPATHPQEESYWGNVNPIGSRSCYDEGKRAAETLFMDFHRTKGVPVKLIRIFNTYGPNMSPTDGRIISNFIMQALSNKDLTIYGDGTQTRSFQYIDDLIEGMVRVMQTKKTFTGPINLGNPEEYSVKDIAEIIIRMTGSFSKIKYCQLPEDDPKQRMPNIDKATKELNGWSPSINLEEGLKKTIEYFKKFN